MFCDISRRKSRGLYFDRSVGCARSPAGRTTASHQHSGRSSSREEQAAKMNLNTHFLEVCTIHPVTDGQAQC